MTQAMTSNLQAELARQILALVLAGRWRLGERVPEQQLAAHFSVSRSPVRGALSLLAKQGVMRREPNKGFALARLPDDGAAAEEIAPASQVDEIYSRLMSDRAASRLPREVSEAELVERYAVGKGVLRKALMRLSADGLIHRLRGHGWGFAESLDTAAALRESYRFRIIIECGALRDPDFTIRPGELLALRAAHMAMIQSPPPDIRRDDWFRMNVEFHETLVAWSGNRFLLQAIRQQNNIRRMTEYTSFQSIDLARVQSSCSAHLAILDALESGDIDFAEALLRRHLGHAAQVWEASARAE
jgi:DNA-binding GntR family transcriptional regulator